MGTFASKSHEVSCLRPCDRIGKLNETYLEVKGRLQSLLRMCDRFVMRSLLITSFQSHGVNENTRGRLNRSLWYCKERWRIKSWHKNCCFESFKIKQLILDSGNAANRVAQRFNYLRLVAFASDAVNFVRDFESHYRILTSHEMLTGSLMQCGKKYIVLLLHNKEMLS